MPAEPHKSNRNVSNEERQDAFVDRAIMMVVTMSSHFIVKLVVRERDAFDDFPEPLRDDGINIMMTPSRMMTGTAMSGHFIVKLVVRAREVGEVLLRRRKTRVFPSP